MAATPLIAVVDYGAGNLRSVARALERSGFEPQVTGDPADVLRADGVVLPGVGAFRDAITRLADKGLDEALRQAIAAGRPYLGLCLGLQVLFEESDEHGRTPGLGLLRGRVGRFPERDARGALLRVPHIGWNAVAFQGEHPMVGRLPRQDAYYFVHAYRAEPADPGCVAGVADHGGPFAAAFGLVNVFGVQFHGENSPTAGRRLLDAWRAELDRA